MRLQRTVNCLLLAIIFVIYITVFYFKKQTISFDFLFIRNHLNDVLAPIALLSFFSLQLNIQQTSSITSAPLIFVICTFCSIIWEVITPLLNHHTTADYIDALSYYFGGFCYCALINTVCKCTKAR